MIISIINAHINTLYSEFDHAVLISLLINDRKLHNMLHIPDCVYAVVILTVLYRDQVDVPLKILKLRLS